MPQKPWGFPVWSLGKGALLGFSWAPHPVTSHYLGWDLPGPEVDGSWCSCTGDGDFLKCWQSLCETLLSPLGLQENSAWFSGPCLSTKPSPFYCVGGEPDRHCWAASVSVPLPGITGWSCPISSAFKTCVINVFFIFASDRTAHLDPLIPSWPETTCILILLDNFVYFMISITWIMWKYF